jgi:hypothetical protein
VCYDNNMKLLATLTESGANPSCQKTDLGCIPTDPYAFVGSMYGIGLGIIGGVSLLFLIYGAYQIMISQGNPLRLNNGKSYVYYAIAGLVLAIFGYVALQLIAVDILHIPDIK